MKNIFGTIGIAAVTSILTFAGAKRYIYNDTPLPAPSNNSIVKQAAYNPGSAGNKGGYINLEDAAENSVKSVVHINVKTAAQVVETNGNDFFSQFFGNQRQYIPPQAGSGSGVIISADGYVVTNNHVVNNANEVTVTLNDRRIVEAKVIGTDHSTDLALLKINETNLPYLKYANSDEVRLGEWVLAVGYPLQLESTVTAGIVSAKSRRLGINEQNNMGGSSIESFIQTDAAVNPGNSGGALVNANGDLIGINSAIASPTGSYAGYSYAIPSNLVKKVITDLQKYGNVQRAYLGIVPLLLKDATPEQISAYKLDKIDGIYIYQVSPGGAAEKAGIKKGDFITAINNVNIKNFPELQGQLGNYKPGDKINLNYLRDGKTITTSATLKNASNTTDIVKFAFWEKLGASYRTLNRSELQQLEIDGGLLVSNVGKGLIAQQTKMAKQYVIISANGRNIRTEQDLKAIVQKLNSGDVLELSGLYPGYRGQYDYSITMR